MCQTQQKSWGNVLLSFCFTGLQGPVGLDWALTGPAPKPRLSSIGDHELLLNTHLMLAQCAFGAGLDQARLRPSGPTRPTKKNPAKHSPMIFVQFGTFFFWLSMLSLSLCLTLEKLAYIFHPNFVIFSWGELQIFVVCSWKDIPWHQAG